MKLIFNPFFFFQTFIYLSIYYCKHTGIRFPRFLENYLSDLLCLPIALTLSLWVLQGIIRNPEFELNKYMVAAAWLYFSIVFELILPLLNPGYTADLIDVLMYAIGGCFFYFVQMPLCNIKLQGKFKNHS